jgi:hypothetical protein
MLTLRAIINIEGRLSYLIFPLVVGAYIRARALLVISLIWFGYIARLYSGGEDDRSIILQYFYLQYLHGPRGRSGGSQHPVEVPGYGSMYFFRKVKSQLT